MRSHAKMLLFGFIMATLITLGIVGTPAHPVWQFLIFVPLCVSAAVFLWLCDNPDPKDEP